MSSPISRVVRVPSVPFWCAVVAIAFVATAHAATFPVDSTADAVDAVPGDGSCATAGGACTLRAAIQEANALAGADAVTLPAGVYVTTIAGVGEDAAATGDLDVTDDLTITGVGDDSASGSLIDGGSLDRVVHVVQGTVALQDLQIRRGAATPPFFLDSGGDILNGGTLTLTDVTLAENLCLEGCGVRNNGTLTVSGGTIRDNGSDGAGGGIYNDGTLTLTGVLLAGNRGDGGSGGGVLNAGTDVAGATATIVGCRFVGNTAEGGQGGAIANDNLFFETPVPTVTLTDSTFEQNAAEGGEGGGIYSTGVLTLVNTTLRDNSADGGQGGAVATEGEADLVNVTMTGNTANGGEGSALWQRGAGVVRLSNVTIARNGNPADAAAAVDEGGETGGMFAKNSIIALNLSSGEGGGADCTGSGFESLGYNVFGCLPGGYQPTDQTGSFGDTLLASATADNGGPVPTLALTAGSNAIDHGDPGGCTDHDGAPITTDARGVARPQGSRCDVGAFERLPGGSLADAVVRFGRLGPPVGDETMNLRARIVGLPGTPALDPTGLGAQLLVVDRGVEIDLPLNVALVELLAATLNPIPPGPPGTGCGPEDGWKRNTSGTSHNYRNMSGALPPSCAAGSAAGLRGLRFRDRRARDGSIHVKARAKNASIASSFFTQSILGPVEVVIVIEGSETAAVSGPAAWQLLPCTVTGARATCGP